jgi:putative phage-type endonuclease
MEVAVIHDIPQGSEAWKALRCGKVTASKVADVIARTKSGGYGASRANYRAALVLERMTGTVQDFFQTPAMLHGTMTEPEACDAYCQHMLCRADTIGFVDHPAIPMSGASPDRLIGDDGLLECKCPQPAAHMDVLLNGKVPEKYITQINWQLACMPERKWADFISYSPAFPEPMRLFIQRIPRDDEAIAELEREVTAFLAEVDETVAALRARYGADLEQQLTQSLERAA